MSRTLWIDIETRSRVNLKRTGVYRYVRCPDFQILMAVWSDDGETYHYVEDQEELFDIPGLWSPKVTKVAHNAPFERICFSAFRGLAPGKYLPPEEWRDTMAIGAELGYPKSLSALAKSLGASPKDEAGTSLINLFSKPNRNGQFNDKTTHPEKWIDFGVYCRQDVITLVEVDQLLEQDGGWPTKTEEQVYLADQHINDRGIAIDVNLAHKAARVGSRVTEQQKDRVRDLTLWEVENPGSIQQLRKWFASQGFPLKDMKKETVEHALLRRDLPEHVREVLELRQELALAAPAKFGAALESQVEGRLCGTFAFFGAHTGRWAGRGPQPHNLPRAAFKPDPPDLERIVSMHDLGFPKDEIVRFEAEAAARVTEREIARIVSGEDVSSLTLKKSVRPMLLVDGVVFDYSAIEARVIAWLAGEEWALQAFRDGRDIYVETAKQMGGLSRAQGKIAVLALGYNGGAGSLKAMAGDNDYMPTGSQQSHGKSSTAPTQPEDQTKAGRRIIDEDDEKLYEMFVYPWREANSKIVRLWADLERAFRTGGAVGEHLAFEKAHGSRDRLLRLPSGRVIAYRRAGIQKRMKLNPRSGKMEERKVLTFWSPSGYRADTYGGRLAENATQAVARDILAEALVRLEKAGLEVVAHVHDEVIIQGTRDLDAVREIMNEVPSWAEGLPIDSEGFECTRYRKG